MQIDLSTCNIDNSENINLLNQEAYSNVIAGIYAINKSVKKYQTKAFYDKFSPKPAYEFRTAET